MSQRLLTPLLFLKPICLVLFGPGVWLVLGDSHKTYFSYIPMLYKIDVLRF